MIEFTIDITEQERVRTVKTSGVLDKKNSDIYGPQLLATTKDVDKLILDFSELKNITSAGLRILLKMQLEMDQKGGMCLRHVNEMVMEVLTITGFSNFLTIDNGKE